MVLDSGQDDSADPRLVITTPLDSLVKPVLRTPESAYFLYSRVEYQPRLQFILSVSLQDNGIPHYCRYYSMLSYFKADGELDEAELCSWAFSCWDI
jgi:hypothetical protein